MADGESVVYFVQAGEFIKIGTTTNLRARIAALQNGSPFPITLLHTLPGACEKERAIQKHFYEFRIRGEWYEDAPELRRFIEKGIVPQLPTPLKQPPRAPLLQPDCTIEPQDGVISVSGHVPPHAKGEDVVTFIKFHTYLVIDTVVEAGVEFDALNIAFDYPLSGEKIEVARASFTREKCLYIVTPYVHFFGALEFATSIEFHPALAQWKDFPSIVIGPHGRPIVDVSEVVVAPSPPPSAGDATAE